MFEIKIFQTSYRKFKESNENLPIGIAEGNREEVNLKEDSPLVPRRPLHQRAYLICQKCRVSASVYWGFHGPVPFCPILGMVTFLSENDISVQLEGLTCFWLVTNTLYVWCCSLWTNCFTPCLNWHPISSFGSTTQGLSCPFWRGTTERIACIPPLSSS